MAGPTFGTRHQNLVKFGVSHEEMVEWVVKAEAVGFESVHVPARALGDPTGNYPSTTYDPPISLAHYAEATEEIRFGTMVVPLAYRHPLSVAKTFGTLDHTSGGRLIFGVGWGWSKHEFAAFDKELRRRGQIFEESVELIRKVWRESDVDFHGEEFDVTDVTIETRPGPDREIPFWFGTFSPSGVGFPPNVERSLAQVGKLADGWVPLVYSMAKKDRMEPEHLAQAWERIESAAVADDRDPDSITVVHAEWFHVIESEADREDCVDALEGWFGGDVADAKNTFVVGTPEEIADEIVAITSGLPRVDHFVLGPLSYDHSQLERCMDEVVPLVEERL